MEVHAQWYIRKSKGLCIIRHIRNAVPTSNFCTKCVFSPAITHDRTSEAIQFPVQWCMKCLTTEDSLDSQATCMWVIDVLGLFFDIRVCTTRHWQTSRPLVQEVNVYFISALVYILICMQINTLILWIKASSMYSISFALHCHKYDWMMHSFKPCFLLC